MLYAAAIVMTVMGCGDEAMECSFIEQFPGQWESKAACDVAIPDVLLANQNYDYPVITAQCEEKSAGSLQADARNADEQPSLEKSHATPVPPEGVKPQDRASNPALYRLKDGYALVRDETSDFFEKLGQGAVEGYKRFDGAVKESVENLSEATRQTLEKIKKSLTPKN